MKLEVEPIKNLSRYMSRNFKDLERDEFVDMIHTTVLAASVAKTLGGARIHVSVLVGILDAATKSLGQVFAKDMMESADSVSSALQEVLESIYRARCKSCPDRGVCPDGGGDPPVVQ